MAFDLYSKASTTNAPPIIVVHGGGWSSGDKTMNEAIATDLASRGYVVASIEYRLSTEAIYPAAICDIKSAVIFMKKNAKRFGIDSSKVALIGFSAGGQLAALAGATNGTPKFTPKRSGKVSANVAAAIDVDGILDFTVSEKSLIDTSGSLKSDLKWLGGTFISQIDRWVEASPVTWVNKNTAPMLFINSSSKRFHCGRDMMIEKLNHFGVYSEIYTFKDTPHTFWLFNPWYKKAVGLMDTFLRKVMKIE